MILPDEQRLKQFFDLAYERHRIYVLKELGAPKPWTADPIFKNWFFCNVFRAIDKTTKFIIEQVIQPNEDNPLLWKAIILCRLLSRIETIQYLLDNNAMFDFPLAYKLLRERQQRGEPVFTGAFIINSVGFKGNVDKINYVFLLLNQMTQGLHNEVMTMDEFLRCTASMVRDRAIRTIYGYLRLFNGVGDFMGYEYVTDLSYSERYLKNAADKYTWMTYGLGAVRGMNRLLYGKPSSNKIQQPLQTAQYVFKRWKEYIEEQQDLEEHKTILIATKQTPPEKEPLVICKILTLFTPFYDLTMREVEHWLCEYDKYCRGGSAKRRYDGNG